MAETRLYPPVKAFLVAEGYEVRAEVRGCDVVARRGDELVVVELKESANLKLFVQACARQSVADLVYVAIPEPKRKGQSFRGLLRLLRRLQLGLLLVRETPLGSAVRPMLEPSLVANRKNRRERAAIIKEASTRSGDHNIAGSTGVALVTVYREHAILIACCLEVMGQSSPKQLRAACTGPETRAILADNHYGWFERVSHGVYGVTKAGIKETKRWPVIRRSCLKLIKTRATLDP